MSTESGGQHGRASRPARSCLHAVELWETGVRRSARSASAAGCPEGAMPLRGPWKLHSSQWNGYHRSSRM